MSGHRPFSDLTKHYTDEQRRLNAIGFERLKVKVAISEVLGEELLRENDDLCDLLCEAELDFSDRELVIAIEKQVRAAAGTPQNLSANQLQRIAELTGEVRNWIALSESTGV